jgi:hypothetical protein
VASIDIPRGRVYARKSAEELMAEVRRLVDERMPGRNDSMQRAVGMLD